MKPLQQIAYIFRMEWRGFVRHPKMLIAAAAVVVLPTLYALIYLSSVWDAGNNTQSLSVGLVNLDEGLAYRQQEFNVGEQVVAKLRANHRFGYVDVQDAASAKLQVQRGHLAFALIIPQDFSSNAVPGAQPGGGKLVIYSTEGNNYDTAIIAREFATELGHQVNESLNERRWALVLNSASGSQHSIDQLRQGVHELHHGAEQLQTGAEQAAIASQKLSKGTSKAQAGVQQLTDGMRQLGAGLRTMDAKRPRNHDLKRLRAGAESLASGDQELSRGLDTLQAGSSKIRQAVEGFQQEANDSLLAPDRLKEGTMQLAHGAAQLDDGLKTADNAQHQLADGADQLSAGVTTLTEGVHALSQGIHTAASKLPEDNQLDTLDQGMSTLAHGNAELADGLQKLQHGSQSLSAGLDLLAHALPANIDAPGGSAAGMAHSVLPVMEVSAPIANSGSGFIPNILPAALWLGAGVAAFLIHARTLPRHAQQFHRTTQLLGKIAIPAVVVILQALLLGFSTQRFLALHVAHEWAYGVTLLVSGVSFLAIVLLLSRALGDAGKALAMVLLAVQLSSSGGVLPVELSGGWFTQISPWLPMTWVVRAIKASVFGAFEGNWLTPLLVVASSGLTALGLAIFVGRWRFVKANALRPVIDL